MNMNPKTRVAMVATLTLLAALSAVKQGDVQAEATMAVTTCSTGSGENALTIALPTGAANRIDGVYIRRAGCSEWSKNLGAVLPGKSIHLFNLDDGELEVFWREHPHAFGTQPVAGDMPPTEAEWNASPSKRRMSFSNSTHRRIVVS